MEFRQFCANTKLDCRQRDRHLGCEEGSTAKVADKTKVKFFCRPMCVIGLEGASSFFISSQSFFLPASPSFPWPVDNSVGVKLPSVD